MMRQGVQTHSHFVSVLAGTLEILIPHISPAKTGQAGPNDPDKNKSAKPTRVHSNRFANREMEDLGIQESTNALDKKAKTLNNAPALAQESGKTVYEVETSNEGVIYAVYCMLEDQDRIQDNICQLWQDYFTGHVSLITASATSNTVIEVV